METAKASKMNWTRRCIECNVNFCIKDAYILHLLGKRHQKNVKKREKVNAVRDRIVRVSGKRNKVAVEKIVGYFLEYGINNVTHCPDTVFIEFDTAETAQRVLQKRNYNIRTAFLRVSPMKTMCQDEDRKITISSSLKNRLSQPVTGSQLDKHISFLIKEVELKPRELEDREILRNGISNYLRPYFSQVYGYIFGSSSNNLGFTGCDVDIYLDIGVYPWENCATKVAAQAQARDITWFLARKIRESGRAIKVEAVPRARVPIVKFQDRSSKIMVDLSFRHGMPVYNTRLISQYTHTHVLVRPYLMVIRYWAKIQVVAGGGQPSHLITNYALTMMMLFYLMCRNDPIVPSVSYLRSNRTDYTPVFIGPWDVGFSCNVSEWSQKFHDVNVMELVSEFFSFYGTLKASHWVISPLAGKLLARKDVQDMSLCLPKCLNTYLQQDDVIQLDTELCVQDPFEHSHNCTRGLTKSSFIEFQCKCRAAASVSKNILKGEKTLNDLFQPIEITPDMISGMCQTASKSDDEVITLDDSDVAQDIEVVITSEEMTQNVEISNSERTADVEIWLSPNRKPQEIEIISDPQDASQDCEILAGHEKIADSSTFSRKISKEEPESLREHVDHDDTQSESSSSCVEIFEGYTKNCNESLIKNEGRGLSEMKVDSSNSIYPVVVGQLSKCSIFSLDYSQVPEFEITHDGNIDGKRNKLFDESDIGKAACLLVEFVLQQCLKIELTTLEICPPDEKVKSLMQGDETNTLKAMKGVDEKCVTLPTKYLKISKYMCLATLTLWNGRKKMSKQVTRTLKETPLQYELAVTRAQIANSSHLPGSNSFKFTIEVWQELANPNIIHVTGNSLADTKVTQSQMIPMFTYISSLCQNLLKKLTHYVKTGF